MRHNKTPNAASKCLSWQKHQLWFSPAASGGLSESLRSAGLVGFGLLMLDQARQHALVLLDQLV
jgi:hypothetical protein